jgi:addiction module toxin, relE/stbE family
MLKLVTTGTFRKDYKRIKKRGYDISLLETVLEQLLSEKKLEEKYRDHALVGNYAGFRECHILPDWLLIYAINNSELILTASRTGTHSDLFDK